MSIYIISELCGQWGGSLDKAKIMIDQSKDSGANAIKVQLWDTYRLPGKNREKWEYLSMTRDQFLELKDYAESLKLDYFASPFHEDRFEWILEAGLQKNKIASSMLEWDFDLCTKMANSGIETFCSLGKWTKKELPFTNDNVSYMHCVAKYPHTYDKAMALMPEKFEGPLSGYSDHSIGIEACVEAVDRGAKFIEKHFTLDKALQSDTEGAHVCSMESKDLYRLRSLCNTV